jgi:hypothetical protein
MSLPHAVLTYHGWGLLAIYANMQTCSILCESSDVADMQLHMPAFATAAVAAAMRVLSLVSTSPLFSFQWSQEDHSY